MQGHHEKWVQWENKYEQWKIIHVVNKCPSNQTKTKAKKHDPNCVPVTSQLTDPLTGSTVTHHIPGLVVLTLTIFLCQEGLATPQGW